MSKGVLQSCNKCTFLQLSEQLQYLAFVQLPDGLVDNEGPQPHP